MMKKSELYQTMYAVRLYECRASDSGAYKED